jgi:flagella basal body P-ring formation protein FlgA
MRRLKRSLLICLLIPGTLLAAKREYAEEQKIRILFPETALVEGEEYSLSEIATLEGADFALVERAGKVKIGRSPLPGRKLTVTRSLVLSRLRSAKLDPERLDFPQSESTQVMRAALKVVGEDLDQVVMQFIEQQYPEQDIKPRLLSRSRDVYLPRGEISYEVREKGTFGKEAGYRTYEVLLNVNGELSKTVPVRVYLKLYKEVYVAKETIKRDEIIEEADLVKVRRNIDRVTSAYITDKDSVVGKVASRTIGSNEVIAGNSVVTPPIVKEGDRLTIVYETPNLLLSAQGVSLAKGRVGDRIPVRNVDSKTVVYAQVRDKNVVEVN